MFELKKIKKKIKKILSYITRLTFLKRIQWTLQFINTTIRLKPLFPTFSMCLVPRTFFQSMIVSVRIFLGWKLTEAAAGG